MTLNSVQALRALAVLLVALFHLNAIEALGISEGGGSEAPLVGGVWGNGFAGVDLFFVISGFIMVYVTRGAEPGPRTAGAFLFSRFIRIYPLWWLFASVMLVYFLVVYGTPVDQKHVIDRGQTVSEHLIASYLLLPQPNFPLLGIGWTLVHEMYFYMTFAALLLLPRRWLPIALIVWAALVTLGWAAGLTDTTAADYPALLTYPMTVEFILGALAGLLFQSGRHWRPGLMVAMGALAFAASMLLTPVADKWIEHEGLGAFMLQWGRVLLYGVPSVLLVYGLACLEAAGRFRDIRPLTVIGNWSYALYLSHTIVASGLKQTLPRIADIGEAHLGLPKALTDLFRLGTPGIADNLTFAILAVTAMVIFSGLVHHGFERPVARVLGGLRRRWFGAAADALKPVPIARRVG